MKAFSPQKAAAVLNGLSSLRPRLAIVLGSGLAGALEDFQITASIAYKRIPGFTCAGVEGHPGRVLVGHWAGEQVIVLAGRAHFYEGNPMSAVTFFVRVLAAFGVKDLLLTNCAGGIHPKFRPGDFMIVRDHINLMGVNPLRGAYTDEECRFVDLTQLYDPHLRGLLRRAGRSAGLRLRSGVYLAVSGPSYETPAEIRAFRAWGADAVGMSTVPEAIVARQCGLKVAALSCITNLAAGLRSSPLSHSEVLHTADRVRTSAAKLLSRFARLYGRWAQDSN